MTAFRTFGPNRSVRRDADRISHWTNGIALPPKLELQVPGEGKDVPVRVKSPPAKAIDWDNLLLKDGASTMLNVNLLMDEAE